MKVNICRNAFSFTLFKKQKLSLFLLILTCFSIKLNKSFAQQSALTFQHLTINEGLSQNTVFSIFQDSRGYIWIGTEDGLNRYDGYEFKIFKHDPDDNRSLINNQVNVILEDAAKRLIIGSAAGISIYNRDQEDFDNISIPTTGKNAQIINFISAIVPQKQNLLWLGTYDGLKLLDISKKKLIDNSLSSATNKRKIQTAFKDHKGLLWISFNSQVQCVNLQKEQIFNPPLAIQNALLNNPSDIRVIKQDALGNIWLGSEQSGLFFYNQSTNICVNYLNEPNNPQSLPVNVVRDVFFNEDGKVWIATRMGLSVLDLKTNRFTNYSHDKYNPESLSHRSVLKIMKDKAGSIWIGTFAGGLNLYTPLNSNFTKIGEQLGDNQGLNNPVVSAITHDDNGGLWIGTEGGGLNYLNNYKTQFQVYKLKKSSSTSSENLIKSISRDKKGNLWIGAFDGLYYFDIINKSVKSYASNASDNIPGRNQIYAVLADGDGVWAGTNGGGLFYFNPKEESKIYMNNATNPNSISGNHISSLLKDREGNLWIGTLQGVNYLNTKNGKFTRYLHQTANKYSLNNNNITSLYLDAKQQLCVGTKGGGLNLLDTKTQKFYAFTERDGLANNVIRAINQDKKGNLWLSSNKGLTILKLSYPKGNLPPKIKELKNYTISDGLQSNQFLSGATDQLPNGELLFGGINGISAFDPSQLKTNSYVPSVVFTDFYINNKPIDVKSDDAPIKKHINEIREIKLDYDQANITIKFAALNFVNPNKNKYVYKLEGLSNNDWQEVGNQRIANYTNLNAGNYTFMVKASNNDGVWSKDIATIKIKILPPWYKTWWAYILYSSIFLSLLYYFYYFSDKTIRLKNALDFEQFSHEKDQELAQRKLTFFTHISHEIKTPLTLILSPIEKLLSSNNIDNKVQHQLQIIKRNGERLMRITNQLLDYRKFDSGSMNLQAAEGNIIRFLKEVIAAFTAFAHNQNIDLKLITNYNTLSVWFDRDKMEKVMFNLISNALKFTNEGGYINVRVDTITEQEKANDVIIIVEDNGIGIEEENIKNIFNQFQHYNTDGRNHLGTGIGLSFSKALVELHHGSIKVESTRPAKQNNYEGLTKFTVKIPLGNAHLQELEVIQNYNNSEDINAYEDTEIQQISTIISEKKHKILCSYNKDKPLMLLVEDNDDVREFMKDHFAEDFELLIAEDGEIGVEKALEAIPDIIISDVMMPKLLGTELCSNLKLDLRTSHIPIVLLTAREPLLFKIEGLETGADDYITKPFNLKYLEMRIWNLLESRLKLKERYIKKFDLQPENLAVTSPDEKFLKKAMKYIEENISEPTLSVEELSKEVGMSKTTLYRKIKALTNQNTNEFIRTVRLNRAAQLLNLKKFNVSEVAYQVGFSNLDYFRKCFKEQFGVTPKDFNQSVESVT